MVSGAGRDPDEAFAGRPGEAPAGDADPLGSLVLDAEWAAPGGFPESPVEEPPPDRADDPLAVLEEIYRAEGPRLYGVVLAAVRSPDVAEDVVQEAFLRLVREISRRGAPDNPRAWLVRVALNAVASQGRRSRS
ncbi:MAG TPA: sigma-70 family RNA polymerase sigma factor, partial [Candidatus Limnocylindrales bacterium]|nr:sigma-70 family RNA polymerase sigma factor [Candidatus Limnocylindrales bacterium]